MLEVRVFPSLFPSFPSARSSSSAAAHLSPSLPSPPSLSSSSSPPLPCISKGIALLSLFHFPPFPLLLRTPHPRRPLPLVSIHYLPPFPCCRLDCPYRRSIILRSRLAGQCSSRPRCVVIILLLVSFSVLFHYIFFSTGSLLVLWSIHFLCTRCMLAEIPESAFSALFNLFPYSFLLV
ncbi:hypothetical protein B0H11DRAFT_67908 [Mycena galericulata]|nr:hypothetical protein B0H11DRAFT_67908 [Mycena galericulata]